MYANKMLQVWHENAPASLLDDVAVPVNVPPTKQENEPEPKSQPVKHTRKVKGYVAAKNQAATAMDRKQERKAAQDLKKSAGGVAVSTNGKRAKSNKMESLSAVKAKAVQALKGSVKNTAKVDKVTKVAKVAKVAKTGNGGKATGSESGVCSICHKPLSRHTSVANGMGDTCATKMKLLPKGMSLEDHYANLTVYDEPGNEYLPVKKIFEGAAKQGVSEYRMIIAYGGDRMLRPPLNKHFKVVLYKGRKFMLKSCLNKEVLAELKK